MLRSEFKAGSKARNPTNTTICRHGDRMITVRVGENEKQRIFDIHENPLSKHSSFFEAALTPERWKEQEDRSVALPEHDVEAFEIWKHFVYSGAVFSQGQDDVSEEYEQGVFDGEYDRLTNCWVLGEMLGSTSFKDAITDALVSKKTSEEMHPIDLHETIWPASPRHSGMRQLLLDIAVWEWEAPHVEKLSEGDQASSEFYFCLAQAFFVAKGKDLLEGMPPYNDEDTCQYHDHVAEGKPCYKTMF